MTLSNKQKKASSTFMGVGNNTGYSEGTVRINKILSPGELIMNPTGAMTKV